MTRFRKLFRIFLVATIFVATVQSMYASSDNETFIITKLNTPTITIGSKQLKVGDQFTGKNNIKWTDYNQAMEVKQVGTGELYRFSKKVMESKGAILSISDFFLRTNQLSSRVADSMPFKLKQSPVADKFPERRIALVIGNSNYYNLNYLKNAQKDASDVADALQLLGFDVLEAYETNYEEMRTVLNRFSGLAKGYDVALFYFAGHGLQEDGKNYLIPINAELEFRSELSRFLQGDDVLERISATGAPTQFVFIDACRNAKTTWARGATQGLARMEGAPGAVIVFSTESGKVALDGEGDNSPFAASLLKNITANASFLESMNNVVLDTYETTGHRQYPLIIGSPLTKFNFNPGASAVKPSQRQPEKPVQPTPAVSAPIPTVTAGNTATQNATTAKAGTSSSANLVTQAKQLIRKLKPEQAVPYLKEAAQNGNTEAYYLLGELYYNGNGVAKSFATAKSYYEVAANAGMPEAQYMMGVLYRNGQGVDKNFSLAAQWLEKAASQGHQKAYEMWKRL